MRGKCLLAGIIAGIACAALALVAIPIPAQGQLTPGDEASPAEGGPAAPAMLGREVGRADPAAAARLRARRRLLAQLERAGEGGGLKARAQLALQAEALATTGAQRVLVILVEFAGSDMITWTLGQSNWDPLGKGDFQEVVWNAGPVIGDCSKIITATTPFIFSGPRHNQIERPRSATDSSGSMIWVPDFSPAYYRELFFGNGVWFNYARQDGSPVNEDLRGKSLARYFADMSGGAYTISGEVQGWYALPHSVWWYGADECPGWLSSRSPLVATDGAIPDAGDAESLVREALAAAKTANPGFNWAQFDGDRDGSVDQLWVIFAGLGEEGSTTLLARTSYGEGTMHSKVGNLSAPFELAPGIAARRYVLLPENMALATMASHFGYGLGLEDLGSTDGGTPSVGFWTPMRDRLVGIPSGFQPVALDPWHLDSLGWLKPKVITDATREHTFSLGQASDFPCCSGLFRGAKIRLPDDEAPLPVAPNGSFEWWSGRENLLNARMTTRQTIAIPAGGATLTFKAAWDTEAREDFLWVQVSDDGGASWKTLANGATTCQHNRLWVGTLYGFPADLCNPGMGGFSGTSAGFPAWTSQTFDLSQVAGKAVLLRFWYMTSWSTVNGGAFIDDLRVAAGASTLFEDNAEAGDGKWAYEDGWDRTGATRSYSQSYYLQWRNTSPTGGFDSALGDARGMYGAANSGLLVWYNNNRYPDNEPFRYQTDPPAFGPKGRLLLVDAHPEPYRFPATLAQGYPNEVANIWPAAQMRDAPFSIHATIDFVFRGDTYLGRPGVLAFDDSLGYYPGLEYVSKGPLSAYNPAEWMWSTKHWDASVVIPSTQAYGVKGAGYLAADPLFFNCVITANGTLWCGSYPTGLGSDGGSGNPGDAGGAYGWHAEIRSESESDATVKVWNTNANCMLTCDATVAGRAARAVGVPFEASAAAKSCTGTIAWDVDYGDGSPHGAAASSTHSFATIGLRSWLIKATIGTVRCERRGRILIEDAPEVTVLQGSTEIPDGQTAPVGFGNAAQGEAGPTKVFTVKNLGTATLTLSSLTVPAGFTVTEGLLATLAPGAEDAFTVRLDTAIAGVKLGQLSFRTNDGDEDPFDFLLSGTVIARKFDFGTAASDIETGYTRVTASTNYSDAQGYGWQSGTIGDRDRGAPTKLRRDLNYTALGSFAVGLPNGAYLVITTLGDYGYARDQMGLFLEGLQVASVSTAAKEFATDIHRVVVADGQLNVLLDDLGGADTLVAINGLEIVPVAPTMFDFGGASSPLEPGYTRVTPATVFSQAQGYGWCSGKLDWRDRGTGGALRQDFNFTPLGTFGVTLPNATYDVTFTAGDASGGHDLMGVFFEQARADVITTAPGQVTTRVYRTGVADGLLALLLDDLGGSDGNVVANGLTVAPPPARQFDFGTGSSAVEPSYTRVTAATRYSPWTGYGWLFGTISERLRALGNALTIDLNFTPFASFLVDLPNGVYDVTVTMGDAAAPHDQMAIYLEGAKVDTVTKVAGLYHIGTYRVTVADGSLTVVLEDLGGSDANLVINALAIARVGAFKGDFGTGTSPVEPGYTRVTPSTTYTPARGHGWLSGTVFERDRGTGTALNRDLNFTTNGTFVVDVPSGAYEVAVTMGDAAGPHDQMGVILEGARFDSLTAARNQFVVKRFVTAVTDGQLTVQLQDLGGSDANLVINALEVR
ncbi:MAG: immune inhibitor A domain-containing protein [Acidobacteriota bacterium]